MNKQFYSMSDLTISEFKSAVTIDNWDGLSVTDCKLFDNANNFIVKNSKNLHFARNTMIDTPKESIIASFIRGVIHGK